MSFELDLRTGLPLVRAAYASSSLQFQTQTAPTPVCCYHGPCAIGAMMTPEQRDAVEKDPVTSSSIDILLANKSVIVPPGQVDDFKKLQNAHDSIVRAFDDPTTRDSRITSFLATLAGLEEKYVPSITIPLELARTLASGALDGTYRDTRAQLRALLPPQPGHAEMARLTAQLAETGAAIATLYAVHPTLHDTQPDSFARAIPFDIALWLPDLTQATADWTA